MEEDHTECLNPPGDHDPNPHYTLDWEGALHNLLPTYYPFDIPSLLKTEPPALVLSARKEMGPVPALETPRAPMRTLLAPSPLILNAGSLS